MDQDPDVVVIAGGPAAVSGDVERAIAGAVPDAQVRRVAGQDRYLTAEALAALVREYDPAFAYTATGSGGPEEDTNAYGIACPSGQVLTGISSEGAAVCAVDRDTDTVDGGDAETLDGLDSSQFARSGRVCPKGQVVTGILANASLACAPDQDGSGGTTYVSMHAYEFVGPSIDTIVYGVQRWVYREPGTDGPLYAPVSLPHGATLRSMAVEVMDRGTSNVQVALTRRPLDDFTAPTIAYVRSTGSNGAGEVLTDDGLDEVIDNARYAYALTASAVGPWQGDDQGIEAVVFELDLP